MPHQSMVQRLQKIERWKEKRKATMEYVLSLSDPEREAILATIQAEHNIQRQQDYDLWKEGKGPYAGACAEFWAPLGPT